MTFWDYMGWQFVGFCVGFTYFAKMMGYGLVGIWLAVTRENFDAFNYLLHTMSSTYLSAVGVAILYSTQMLADPEQLEYHW